VADLIATADALHEGLVSPWLSWNVDNPASPVVPTTTLTNIWDGSVARTADTVGVTCPTQYRNTYMATTVPVKCWAYAERTSVGGSLTVRFAGAGGNIDVTVNGTLGIFEATGTLVAQSGGDKVDVLASEDVAGTVGNIYAVGIYPYYT
jgi:hypothetical protein